MKPHGDAHRGGTSLPEDGVTVVGRSMVLGLGEYHDEVRRVTGKKMGMVVSLIPSRRSGRDRMEVRRPTQPLGQPRTRLPAAKIIEQGLEVVRQGKGKRMGEVSCAGAFSRRRKRRNTVGAGTTPATKFSRLGAFWREILGANEGGDRRLLIETNDT